MSAQPFLDQLQSDTRDQFERDRAILSFEEYLDEVSAHPERHLRDATRYLYDAVQFWGSYTIDRPYGKRTRYRLFDAPFSEGRDAVAGQEEAQEQIMGLLDDFAREGRPNRLILLHGPNGSAKTSMIGCLQRGLEHYSLEDEGALYTFSWLFPHKQNERGGIGFGQGRGSESVRSFTELTAGSIDARVSNELRDHPLLLLPKAARHAFLEGLKTNLGASSDARSGVHATSQSAVPTYIAEGELSPQSAAIFEALLKEHQGDIREVFKYVQVERFSISRRYRRGATTIDPQMRADAQVRQVTADRSMNSLPRALQHLNLFEPLGHLVEGNRGVIEYNDLLKRPVEAFKYLLSTVESGAVRLDHLTLYLDAVLIGSCNFELLRAFIGMPDFASFKGRIELVCVPYLRDIEDEKRVYDGAVASLRQITFVTPDVPEWLARWAVMTRLERPQPVHFPQALRSVIESLTPHEKLELYTTLRAPERLALEERRLLAAQVKTLYHEPLVDELYEGWLGASPRELKGLLLSMGRVDKSAEAPAVNVEALTAGIEAPVVNAVAPVVNAVAPVVNAVAPVVNAEAPIVNAEAPVVNAEAPIVNAEAPDLHNQRFISPLRLFKELETLCREEAVYPFLRRKASGAFYQPKQFVAELRLEYLLRFKAHLFQAFGLVTPQHELSQLKEYIRQLRYFVRNEKVPNPHTGQAEEPNESILREVERRLGIKRDTNKMRDSMIQQVAKWRIENPDSVDLDYQQIFEEELRAMRASYTHEAEEVAETRLRELMVLLEDEVQLDSSARARAENALEYLNTHLGYHAASILETLHSLPLLEQ